MGNFLETPHMAVLGKKLPKLHHGLWYNSINLNFFQLRAVDLLHKAAYRCGLGNSLFIAKYNIEKIDPETLLHFANCNLTADKATVVGLGVDHKQLTYAVEKIKFHQSAGQALNPSPYKGGEIR